MKRLVTIAAVAAAAAVLSGCEEEIVYGTFEITTEEKTFSGTSADCGLNTSAPDGDPLLGTFYFSIISDDGTDEPLLLGGGLPDFTSAPDPGTYSVPDEASMNVTVGEEHVEPLTGSIVISTFEEGLSIDFSGMTNVQGRMNCLM